jgi:hypothetical protein
MLEIRKSVFYFKICFYLLLNLSLHFPTKRRSRKCVKRFIVNEYNCLNIIPSIMSQKWLYHIWREDWTAYCGHNKSFNMVNGSLIMKEVGYEYLTLQNSIDFTRKKHNRKIVLWKYWKTLKSLFYDSCEWIRYHFVELILEIPKLDEEAFTNMIRYADWIILNIKCNFRLFPAIFVKWNSSK